MEMSLHFRVHAQLRKEGKSAFIADRFVLRRRVRQRCHLQWTDSCRGVVGSQTLMDMCSPEPCQGTFRLPSMGGGILFCRLLHILNAFKSKDCHILGVMATFLFLFAQDLMSQPLRLVRPTLFPFNDNKIWISNVPSEGLSLSWFINVSWSTWK